MGNYLFRFVFLSNNFSVTILIPSVQKRANMRRLHLFTKGKGVENMATGKEIVRLSPGQLSEPLNLVPDLVQIPGYVALNEKEREWLRNETSIAVGNARKAAMHNLMFCIDLARVEKFLKDKPMSFSNWLSTVFPSSRQTGVRGVKTFRELNAYADEEALINLAEHGIAGMQNMQAGRLVPVIKKVPPPTVNRSEPKMAKWRQKVTEELRKTFRNARIGREEEIDPETAMKLCILHCDLMMRKAKLGDSATKKAWLRKMLGYLMEKQAIPGTVSAERTPHPPGFLPKRGRPRKQGK